MIAALLAACCAGSSVLLAGAALGSRSGVAGPSAEPQPARVRRPSAAVPRRARIAAAAAFGGALGAVVAGPPGLIGGAIAGGVLPPAIERRRNARRVHLLEEQLVDAVTAIASALRSGRSLLQALELAGREVGQPLGPILTEAADRSALGVPFDDVLDDLRERIGGSDARLVTGVLRLHRRTGGALATSLDDLVRTLRSRRDGARELRSLTAQARLSATILGVLPLGFFLFLSIVARRDVEAAYRSSLGLSAIAIGLLLQIGAFAWIRSLLRVEPA